MSVCVRDVVGVTGWFTFLAAATLSSPPPPGRQKKKVQINKKKLSLRNYDGTVRCKNTYILWSPYFSKNYIHTLYVLKKTLYLIKMITASSFFKLSYPEGQLGWVLFFFFSLSPMQLQLLSLSLSLLQSVSLSLHRSLSPSFPSLLHCGSVNCSYSNIPSLPSPQLSFSQPLSCGIINLLVLSTCKSQTIEPYGAVWGAPLFIL